MPRRSMRAACRCGRSIAGPGSDRREDVVAFGAAVSHRAYASLADTIVQSTQHQRSGEIDVEIGCRVDCRALPGPRTEHRSLHLMNSSKLSVEINREKINSGRRRLFGATAITI